MTHMPCKHCGRGITREPGAWAHREPTPGGKRFACDDSEHPTHAEPT